MTEEFTWYLSRAAGLVAWILLAVAMIWGLLLTSRLMERRPSPAWLLDLHRHLGSLALTLTLVHVAAIWFDDFVEYTVVEILVPFTSDLERLPVAFGAIAFWLLLVVQLTAGRRARIPAELWRRLHWLSVPLFVLAGLHGWLVGTDVDHPVAAVIALVLMAETVLIAGLRVSYGRRPLPLQSHERQRSERQGDTRELRA